MSLPAAAELELVGRQPDLTFMHERGDARVRSQRLVRLGPAQVVALGTAVNAVSVSAPHRGGRLRWVARDGGEGTLVFDIISIQALGGDGAVVLGRWKLTDTREPGAGIFSVALRRTAKGWRIVHDHTSKNPEPIVP